MSAHTRPGRAEAGASPKPSFDEMTRTFGKIGVLGFGGPAGQIALMHRVLVEEKRWIGEDRFLHALNFCMLLPGPEAQQLATYVGWLLHGTRGAVAAGVLFIVPGLLVILGLSVLYAEFGAQPWLAGIMYGLKAAVLAIVLQALLRIARRALADRWTIAVAAAAFVLMSAFAAPFPLVVLIAGMAGFLCSARGGGRAVPTDVVPAAGGGLRGAGTIVLVGGVLWAAPPLLLALWLGRDSVYPQLALFFSKLSVVTFGGAYAVLAYVAQAAVAEHGWLRPGEMLDGLALAETTPGPLVLVLCFVGFLSAFRDPAALSPLLGGLVAGLLTAWVSFLPSFLFVLVGAPHMERLRSNRRLSGTLRAITAAVVGVMLNLAIWFALHALFTQVRTLTAGPVSLALPVWSSLDPAALGLTATAALCLFALRLGLAGTLAAAACLGYAARAVAPT